MSRTQYDRLWTEAMLEWRRLLQCNTDAPATAQRVIGRLREALAYAAGTATEIECWMARRGPIPVRPPSAGTLGLRPLCGRLPGNVVAGRPTGHCLPRNDPGGTIPAHGAHAAAIRDGAPQWRPARESGCADGCHQGAPADPSSMYSFFFARSCASLRRISSHGTTAIAATLRGTSPRPTVCNSTGRRRPGNARRSGHTTRSDHGGGWVG